MEIFGIPIKGLGTEGVVLLTCYLIWKFKLQPLYWKWQLKKNPAFKVRGNPGNPGNPGSPGNPGNPGNRGAVNYGFPDVWRQLL